MKTIYREITHLPPDPKREGYEISHNVRYGNITSAIIRELWFTYNENDYSERDHFRTEFPFHLSFTRRETRGDLWSTYNSIDETFLVGVENEYAGGESEAVAILKRHEVVALVEFLNHMLEMSETR